MLLELQGAEPQLAEVQTWNAPENDPMAGVNAELGYQPDRQWREYEADVFDLITSCSRDRSRPPPAVVTGHRSHRATSTAQ